MFAYDQDIIAKFPSSKTAWHSNQRRFISKAGDKIDLISVFIPQGFDSESVSPTKRKNDAPKTFVFSQHGDSEVPPIDISSFERVLKEIDEFEYSSRAKINFMPEGVEVNITKNTLYLIMNPEGLKESH